MTESRSIPFPWPLGALLALPLLLPITQSIRDLQTQRLTAEARALQATIDVDPALERLREAASVNPRDARVQLQLAEALRTLWFYRRQPALKADADQAFETAKTLSPSWPTPHYQHALMYAFVKDYARALTLLQGALNLDPNNASYWLQRGRYLELSGARQAAMTDYRRCWAIDVIPECKDALLNMGVQP